MGLVAGVLCHRSIRCSRSDTRCDRQHRVSLLGLIGPLAPKPAATLGLPVFRVTRRPAVDRFIVRICLGFTVGAVGLALQLLLCLSHRVLSRRTGSISMVTLKWVDTPNSMTDGLLRGVLAIVVAIPRRANQFLLGTDGSSGCLGLAVLNEVRGVTLRWQR